jgi:hypothetical protein
LQRSSRLARAKSLDTKSCGILLVEGLVDVPEQVDDRVGLLDEVAVPAGLGLQALDLAQELRRLDPLRRTAVEEIDEAVGPPHDLIDVVRGDPDGLVLGELVQEVGVHPQPRDA